VDALITNEPGFTLLARSADCPLVLLLDTVSGSLGVVHSGWRGTFLNIVNAAVRGMMLHFGAEPKNMSAGIGPSISLRHYRVGIKSINLFKNTVPAEELSRCYHFDGKDYSLNLKSIIAWQLEQAGIKKIALSEQCTFEQAELFFSYRREGSKTGRFGLLARLKKAIGYCMV
jgi:YfiH family protein